MSEITVNAEQLRHLLAVNAYLFRRDMLRQGLDPRRDIERECGYPALGVPLERETLQRLYDREPIAARVVEVLPGECWQVQPTVYEDEAAEGQTAFEAAWDALGRGLCAEQSYHRQEEGSPVWNALARLDVLSGIGRFGVLLLGLDDGLDLREPATPAAGRRLLYLRPFPESLAQATRFEADLRSPRYGRPTEYLITLNDPRQTEGGGVGLNTGTHQVHWSRVLHVPSDGGVNASEVFGPPRMEPVYGRLIDLRKLYGGSGEMYWRGALPGLSLETHPNLGGDVDVDVPTTRDDVEQYMNGLQRWLLLTGMSAKSLAPQVVDPTPQILCHLQAIAIKIGMPLRILMGSERGSLASDQDDDTWQGRLRGRRRNWLTPRLVCPLVDRLINLGVLPAPQSYAVGWPDAAEERPGEQAAVTLSRTQALAAYVQSGAEAVMAPADYLTREMSYDEEEAEAILEAAAARVAEMPDPADGMEGGHADDTAGS